MTSAIPHTSFPPPTPDAAGAAPARRVRPPAHHLQPAVQLFRRLPQKVEILPGNAAGEGLRILPRKVPEGQISGGAHVQHPLRVGTAHPQPHLPPQAVDNFSQHPVTHSTRSISPPIRSSSPVMASSVRRWPLTRSTPKPVVGVNAGVAVAQKSGVALQIQLPVPHQLQPGAVPPPHPPANRKAPPRCPARRPAPVFFPCSHLEKLYAPPGRSLPVPPHKAAAGRIVSHG